MVNCGFEKQQTKNTLSIHFLQRLVLALFRSSRLASSGSIRLVADQRHLALGRLSIFLSILVTAVGHGLDNHSEHGKSSEKAQIQIPLQYKCALAAFLLARECSRDAGGRGERRG